MLLLTYTNQSKRESPLFVHSNLLDGRTIRYKHWFCKAELKTGWDNIEDLTIQIGLSSRRALTLWSGWLYGRPIWSPSICRDVDRDLECIMNIYQICTGLTGEDEFNDYDGMNACLDAIKDILLNEVHVPGDPFNTIGDAFVEDKMAITMLAELLVYGDCASDGRTQRWLQNGEVTDWKEFSEVHRTMSLEFARKLMGGEAPDFTARCAYHVHPLGEGCGFVRDG
jgi:hypothetical protein